MGTQQAVKLAETFVVQGAGKLKCITPPYRAKYAEQIGLTLKQLASDSIQIHKSPLSEITSYLQGVAREGKGFKPVLENPNSAFAKFFRETEMYNLKLLEKRAQNTKASIFRPKFKEISLRNFKDYIFDHAGTLNVSKQEYWQLVDEVAAKVKRDTILNPVGLRQEFVDNADKIHKWAEIFRTQHFEKGKNIYNKFYDEQMFNQAVDEYIKFAEQITGKKVFVGCRSRMNFTISALGMLNNPNAYKDVDFILLGHGKGSSLITDVTHIDTWRFSDNNKSIWEYIENVCADGKKGEKGLVFCCETDGLRKAGKTAEEMIDNKGYRMYGIGNEVSGFFDEKNPAKIVESGIRHIVGHRYGRFTYTEIGFVNAQGNASGVDWALSLVTDPGTIMYNLNFDKFRVENLI